MCRLLSTSTIRTRLKHPSLLARPHWHSANPGETAHSHLTSRPTIIMCGSSAICPVDNGLWQLYITAIGHTELKLWAIWWWYSLLFCKVIISISKTNVTGIHLYSSCFSCYFIRKNMNFNEAQIHCKTHQMCGQGNEFKICIAYYLK